MDGEGVTNRIGVNDGDGLLLAVGVAAVDSLEAEIGDRVGDCFGF